MPSARTGHSCGLVDNGKKVVVVGGRKEKPGADTDENDTVEIFDLDTEKWEPGGM